MNKIHRRLLSGASFAVIAVAVPQFAVAKTCAKIGYNGHFALATTNTVAGVVSCTLSPAFGGNNTVTVLRGEIHRTAGSGDVTITVVNSGLIQAGAFAHASLKAVANAEGSILSANAGGASVAAVDFVNKGIYEVTASATATGGVLGDHGALAHAEGLVLEAVDATSKATAAFSNAAGAVFHVEAKASAATWNAAAGAIGLEEIALADGSALAQFVNAGKFSVIASARGWTTVEATAIGVAQEAEALTHAEAKFTNSGSFNVSALADEHAPDTGHATAALVGVEQVADALGAFGSATAILNNTGKISLLAKATAQNTVGLGTRGSATAGAFIEAGILQAAIAPSGAAKVSLVNGVSGVIGMHANAFAVASSTDGHALAEASIGGEFGLHTVSAAGHLVPLAGINQIAIGSSAASNKLVNNGLIDMTAKATALGVTSAEADVYIHAIDQFAFAGSGLGSAVNHLTNAGKIDITGHASAVEAFTAGGTAYADVSMDAVISQHAIGGAFASNGFINSGLIHVSGNANAMGAVAHATADISAVFQGASAASTAENFFVNKTGALVSVVANANALGVTDASANAFARGISQHATVTGLKGLAFNSVVNDGVINIAANAKAVAIGDATAAASAGGVSQVAWADTGPGIASDHFVNGPVVKTAGGLISGGLLQVIAKATAHALTTGKGLGGTFASAEASVWAGGQNAWAGTGFAKAAMTNEGIIHAEALASAVAQGFAHASASVTAGYWQNESGNTMIESIVNKTGALIDFTAKAHASALGTAHASAYAMGISQQEFGDDLLGSKGTISLLNEGIIEVFATATAHALGEARARAFALDGVFQSITGASVESNSVINAKGAVIDAFANAKATASGLGGSALATASAIGIKQVAETGLLDTNFVSNDGVIAVGAKAVASGSTFAHAHAHAVGISQSATATLVLGLAAGNQVVNKGVIEVNATATAGHWIATPAYAHAIGITQRAVALGSSGVAANAVTNEGVIEVGAKAHAFGDVAFATANAVGIWQHALAGETASNSVKNIYATTGGTAHKHVATAPLITVHATANATGASIAVANAHNPSTGEIGIIQEAGASSAANNFITNQGDIFIHGSAHAAASGLAEAIATGLGIVQVATHALGFTTPAGIFGVSNTLINSGKIEIGAKAVATGAEAEALAFDLGIRQWALAGFATVTVTCTPSGESCFTHFHDHPGLYANNVVKNSGDINVAATARANGLIGGGFAEAEAEALGIQQEASHAFIEFNTVLNSGIIAPHAQAFAEGWTGAFALAEAHGISQVAFGVGTGVLGNLVTNAAGAEILDTATATAKAGTHASAEALAGGIFQEAIFASVIGNAVVNSGLIDVNAHAKAVGGIAFAFASGYGVVQHAFEVVPGTTSLGVGVNSLINNGNINVSVGANAKGGTVFAEAFGLGVEQYAEGTSAFALSNSVFNGKTASLHVTAHATGSGHGGRAGGLFATPVHATAIGITQANSGFFVGLPAFIENNFVSNNGVIFVSAGAKATGGVYAAAFASAEGIVQRDLNAVFGADTVLNNGSLTAIAKPRPKLRRMRSTARPPARTPSASASRRVLLGRGPRRKWSMWASSMSSPRPMLRRRIRRLHMRQSMRRASRRAFRRRQATTPSPRAACILVLMPACRTPAQSMCLPVPRRTARVAPRPRRPHAVSSSMAALRLRLALTWSTMASSMWRRRLPAMASIWRMPPMCSRSARTTCLAPSPTTRG